MSQLFHNSEKDSQTQSGRKKQTDYSRTNCSQTTGEGLALAGSLRTKQLSSRDEYKSETGELNAASSIVTQQLK